MDASGSPWTCRLMLPAALLLTVLAAPAVRADVLVNRLGTEAGAPVVSEFAAPVVAAEAAPADQPDPLAILAVVLFFGDDNPPPPPSPPPPTTTSGGSTPPPSTSGGGSPPPPSDAPEPATLLSGLIGVGLTSLAAVRRRKK
jgi:hypothetical protein